MTDADRQIMYMSDLVEKAKVFSVSPTLAPTQREQCKREYLTYSQILDILKSHHRRTA